MWMRYIDVDLYVYDPEKNTWKKKANQVVLATDGFLYAIDAAHFQKAVKDAYENSEKFKNATTQKEITEVKKNCFREMLDACYISKNLRGIVYSGNTMYRIEYPERPILTETENEEEK